MEKILINEDVFKSEMTSTYKEEAMYVLNLDITKRVLNSDIPEKEIVAYREKVGKCIESFSLWWDGNVKRLKNDKKNTEEK